MFNPYVKYLSVRDKGGFESESLLLLLDDILRRKNYSFKALSKEYTKRYSHYKHKLLALKKIQDDEEKLAELIDYAKYEIEKIQSINPKVGEETELLLIKQQLSRIDKIKDVMNGAMDIFRLESQVEELYKLLDKDASAFSDMMNQVRADFEEAQNLTDELLETDVEEVLNRLSDLSTLIKRYGSIEEALAYKEKKEKELFGYENISQDKSFLQSFLDLEFSELHTLAFKLSSLRQKEAKRLEEDLASYLSTLKLPKLHFTFEASNLNEKGIDKVDVLLGTSKASTLSGGEFNRVRLALMATSIPKDKAKQGVLILDEIDANVSGDESIAIAQMIQTLSSVYQVFAISHQPHLSAKANQHIVITKKTDKSTDKSKVEVLDEAGRIAEIARIIAGENPTKEAIEFAKKLRS
jgi:DNA repair protein RecN (Recombination protein N)